MSDAVKSQRLIRPVAIHPSRIASKKDVFWQDYSLNHQGVHRIVTNSVQFELDSVQRPEPRRTKSLPPSHRERWPGHVQDFRSERTISKRRKTSKASGINWLRRTRGRALDTFGHVQYKAGSQLAVTVHKAKYALKNFESMPSWLKNRIFRIPKRVLRNAAIGVAAATLIGGYLKFNHDFAMAEAAKPSIITRYSVYQPATWMYFNSPARILGLPDPVVPTAVNRLVYNAAFRKFARKFHPDKAKVNGFEQETAHKVYMRGFKAKEVLDQFYAGPYCWPEKVAVDDFTTSADGLPSYAPGCRCSYPHAVLETVIRSLVPFPLQPAPPQTKAQLAGFCPPCTFSDAAVQWENFNEENRPPRLLRFQQYIHWTQILEDPRIWNFREENLWLRDDPPQHYWSSEEKQMWIDAGWAVEEDFARQLRCVSNLARTTERKYAAWKAGGYKTWPKDDDET